MMGIYIGGERGLDALGGYSEWHMMGLSMQS